MALFSNLRAVHEATGLQQLTMAVEGMRRELRMIKKDVRKVKKDVGKVQIDVTNMRTEMREGFESLETKISVVYVFISFTAPGLTSTRSDHNSLARAHNATVNNSRSPLEGLKTKTDDVPDEFPATLAGLSSLTSMRHFHRLKQRITLTNFSCST
jgi:soluble cytochrome b562